jgi:hypothetical protein
MQGNRKPCLRNVRRGCALTAEAWRARAELLACESRGVSSGILSLRKDCTATSGPRAGTNPRFARRSGRATNRREDQYPASLIRMARRTLPPAARRGWPTVHVYASQPSCSRYLEHAVRRSAAPFGPPGEGGVRAEPHPNQRHVDSGIRRTRNVGRERRVGRMYCGTWHPFGRLSRNDPAGQLLTM